MRPATGAPKLLLLLIVSVLAGCAPSKAEREAERAVNDFMAGDFRRAADRLRPLADTTNENFVLNNLRLGSAALAAYDLDEAEAAFLRAYEVINSYGVNDGGRSLGAVLVDEKIKVWKGEPFERAMANFYLGLVYYMRQDYGNARGAFENALFKLRDYVRDEKQARDDDYREVESNFAVAALMLGKCWQKLGREDLARENFRRAVEAQPKLEALADYDRNLQSNLLLVVDFGFAPHKVTEFDGSIVGFSPTPPQAGPLPRPVVHVDGTPIDSRDFVGAIDTVAMAHDRRWQSIDTIRTVKSAIGTGLIAAGAYQGIQGLNDSGYAQQRDLYSALALLGAGLLLKATSQADVRQWEMLPRTVYVIPLRVDPGERDVLVDFPVVSGVVQDWRGLPVPSTGEATYYFRMQRYNPGPFYWPPHPSRDDQPPPTSGPATAIR